MDFNNLFDDERAVSPVIGVILMVAITVILAAVIGTFVLGLGDQLQTTTPSASIGFNQGTESVTGTTGNSSTITYVTVTHESGDAIAETDLSVSVDGQQAWSLDNTGSTTASTAQNPWDDSGEDVTAGDSFKIYLYDSGTSIAEGNTIEPTADGSDGYGSPSGATELSSGDTVRLIYDNPDSDASSTLAKFELQ